MKCPKCVTGRLQQIETGLICDNCGFRKMTEGAVMTSTSKKGKCGACGRTDVTIVAKEQCWSCYDRIRKGKPIVRVDVSTAEVSTPVPAVLPDPIELPPPIVKKRVVKGLDSLLPVARRGLSMPDELMSNLEEAGISAVDIEFMLRLLLSGQLQRVS